MSHFITHCPACGSANRIPNQRVQESPRCGKCKHALLDGSPIHGTENNFDVLINGAIPTVVDFWAAWCNPCQAFAPVFSRIAEQQQGNMRFIKVDTQEQTALTNRYHIRSIPTIMVFRAGKRLDTLNGALPENQFSLWLEQVLENH